MKPDWPHSPGVRIRAEKYANAATAGGMKLVNG